MATLPSLAPIQDILASSSIIQEGGSPRIPFHSSPDSRCHHISPEQQSRNRDSHGRSVGAESTLGPKMPALHYCHDPKSQGDSSSVSHSCAQLGELPWRVWNTPGGVGVGGGRVNLRPELEWKHEQGWVALSWGNIRGEPWVTERGNSAGNRKQTWVSLSKAALAEAGPLCGNTV